jgi:ATP synthase protein I
MTNYSALPSVPDKAKNGEASVAVSANVDRGGDRRVDPKANPEEIPEVFTPLTSEEAQQLRARQPTVSPWRVLGWQAVLGLAVSLLAWLLTGKANVGVSALYGALAVVLPGAVFARGLGSRLTRANASTAVFGFFLWEVVKIGLTVAMLYAAAKLVPNLSWPGLLVGLVVTMKVYWVALWVRPRAKNKAD